MLDYSKMPQLEQEKIEQLKQKSKEEQINRLKYLYEEETPWLAEGAVRGGSAFARGGFKSTHFPLELIQNADDEEADVLCFEIDEEQNKLFVYDDGQGFDIEGVVAVCQQGRSPKDPRQQIGFMGIGFKSIFEVCDEVEVHSNGYHFAFKKDSDEEGIPGHMIPQWVSKRPPSPDDSDDSDHTTTIVGSIRSLSEVKEALQPDNLSPSVFLFLSSLQRIEIRTRSGDDSFHRTLHGGVGTEPETVSEARRLYLKSDHVQGDPEDEIDDEDLVEVRKTGEEDDEEQWVVFRDVWDIDPDLTRPQMRQELQTSDLFVAFRLDDEGNLTNLEGGGSVRISPVHSYLPLKQLDINLDFLIHAAFDLDPAREGIRSGTEWNKRAADAVRTQCLHAVLDVISDHSQWWRQSHLIVPESQKGENLIVNGILEHFREEPQEQDTEFARTGKDLRNTEFVRDTSREVRIAPNQATITVDTVRDIFTSSEIETIIGQRPVHPDQESVLTRLGIDDTVRLVDILQRDAAVGVLQDHAESKKASNWFSNLYQSLVIEEEEEDLNVRPVRKALANEIILTETGDIVEGRINYYTDDWKPFLPPEDGFEQVSLQRASTVVDLVSDKVLDEPESQHSVTAFFENYGAETATATTVMSEAVADQDIESISKNTCVKVLNIFASGGDEVDDSISMWLQTLELDDKDIEGLRELVSNCAGGIEFSDCLDWLSGRWISLSDAEKRASIRLSKEAYDNGVRNKFDFLRLPTKEDGWKAPENLLPSSPYAPAHDYEEINKEYPTAFEEHSLFLVDAGLKPQDDDSDVWRNFLTHIGAENKNKVNRLAGRVGELFVEREEFEKELQEVTDGADFRTIDGATYIEVKSTKSATKDTVELQDAQFKLLLDFEDREEDQYIVYPVVEALDSPRVSPRPIDGEELLDNEESITFDIDGLA